MTSASWDHSPDLLHGSGICRVLVANRGEIALRAIRVCRRLGIETIAVYSDADVTSPHVWAADDCVCIGPPAAATSYLSASSLLHVAMAKGCDAVYPGYGFLAENAEFAEMCVGQGIKFIGPSAVTMRAMGDKSKAREIAGTFGVPVVPGSRSAFTNAEDGRQTADEVGFPLLLKAKAGGGGRGMRIVNSEWDFPAAFSEASREAEAAFGDGALYLERFFESVRHVEVQVMGDGKGGAIVFDERDCSVQRRHQKLIEESPSPVVDPELRHRLKQATLSLARGIGYEGAGTVEFILDQGTGEFFFIEMNTRIQVEHTVTEMRIDRDLVEMQFLVASGVPLEAFEDTLTAQGHAIEYRINVEDWRDNFKPVPGCLTVWRAPRGPGLRLDTAAYEGQVISPYYDSMIGKLVVYGRDRKEALERSRVALDGFIVEGATTTIGFHRMVIDHDDFLSNRVHTRWLENGMAGFGTRGSA